jgi:hypothetical protein
VREPAALGPKSRRKDGDEGDDTAMVELEQKLLRDLVKVDANCFNGLGDVPDRPLKEVLHVDVPVRVRHALQ